jgi:putative hydrolase of the HAD superfamily
MIKNIIFDFGDVLVQDKTKVLERKYKFDSLPERVRKRYVAAFHKSEVGKMSSAELLKAIDETFPEFTSRKEVLDFIFDAKPLPPWRMARLLKRRGYRVIIFSNNQKTWPARFGKLMHLNFLQFPFLNSAELGMRKPNLRIYRYLIKKFDLKPSETVFIDDRAKNLPPAEQLGIKTFHYQQNVLKLKRFLHRLGVRA